MKKYFSSFLLLALICFILIGCGKKSSYNETSYITTSEIEGTWTMEVQNGNLKGNEEINILPSNNLIVRDSLIFSGEDSGFSFMLPINVNLVGSWNLEKDSLFIKYKSESVDIKLNENEFVIYNNQENADRKVFETLKKEMGDRLFSFVTSYLNESYQAVSDSELLFGKIIRTTPDSLLIRLNNNQFYLTRLEDKTDTIGN